MIISKQTQKNPESVIAFNTQKPNWIHAVVTGASGD